MTTVTLTELNQHPFRVARLAESEPVHVHRYGRGSLVLRREDDPVEDMRAAGLIRAPRAHSVATLPSLPLSTAYAAAAYDDFLASRALDE
jgi:hypothetical protein